MSASALATRTPHRTSSTRRSVIWDGTPPKRTASRGRFAASATTTKSCECANHRVLAFAVPPRPDVYESMDSTKQEIRYDRTRGRVKILSESKHSRFLVALRAPRPLVPLPTHKIQSNIWRRSQSHPVATCTLLPTRCQPRKIP